MLSASGDKQEEERRLRKLSCKEDEGCCRLEGCGRQTTGTMRGGADQREPHNARNRLSVAKSVNQKGCSHGLLPCGTYGGCAQRPLVPMTHCPNTGTMKTIGTDKPLAKEGRTA